MAVSFTTHGHRLDEQLCADLAGHVHFIRISVDGVGATYERARGRSFASLRRGLERARTVAPIGINYVVNASTLPDLDAAVEVASESGAREFLLLPEQPVDGRGGIDEATTRGLRRWVERYTGDVPLVVSEAGADGLPACVPLQGELPLEAYVHIDAMGLVKPSSYDGGGVPVGNGGVIAAIEELRAQRKEDS
jgi:MoaA/NifB/PqqE/SkfB family radical SAM enzyme